MKKIISMGIASAVLALTAIAASADIEATTEATKLATGDTVKVVVKTTADIEDFDFYVLADGLEFVADEAENPAAVGAVQADGSYKINGAAINGWKTGDTIVTLTYTVTAAEGETAAVAVKGAAGYDTDEYVYTTFAPITVGEAGDPTDPTDPTDPADPGNPGTGVALAVVPAVLAGAAVVVAKKRK